MFLPCRFCRFCATESVDYWEAAFGSITKSKLRLKLILAHSPLLCCLRAQIKGDDSMEAVFGSITKAIDAAKEAKLAKA